MFVLVQLLVPICICVVLPVMVVWIIFRSMSNRDNKRAEVMMTAIRSGNSVDVDSIAKAFEKPKKTPAERVGANLTRGCVCSLLGIALLSSYFLEIDGRDLVSVMMVAGSVCLSIGIAFLIVFLYQRRQLRRN